MAIYACLICAVNPCKLTEPAAVATIKSSSGADPEFTGSGRIIDIQLNQIETTVCSLDRRNQDDIEDQQNDYRRQKTESGKPSDKDL